MKQELIRELFEKFESSLKEAEGIECWSARDLQVLFNYSDWRNMLRVIFPPLLVFSPTTK